MDFNTESTPKPKRKRLGWNEGSEEALLNLWPERLEDLRSQRKNGRIYAEMADKLCNLGYKCSPRDVQVKLQNFTQRYRKEKAAMRASGGLRSTWALYERVHQIIGGYQGNVFTESTLESEDANSIAEADSQLFATLCEIDKYNYLYLLERCKICNVNARQLRYLEKDHIRKLIPTTQLGILAEFEYLLNKWKIAKGFIKTTKTEYRTLYNSNNNIEEHQQQLVNRYSPADELAFKSNSSDVMQTDDEEFLSNPSNDEDAMNPNVESPTSGLELNRIDETQLDNFKAWCNRDSSGGRGRLYLRLYNSHRNSELRHLSKKRKLMMQQTETSNSTAMEKAATSNANKEIEELVNNTEGERIQDWLKSHKCENFTEILDMWEVTLKYRCLQIEYLKDFPAVREFLDSWPSYKLEQGHELLNMDFKYLYPQAMKTFRTRWLVYKQKIEALLEADLKDNNCLELLAKYQLQKAHTNEDSSSCVLIHMIHGITKPFRLFKTAHGNVRYTISDSQHSVTRLIRHKSEIDDYRDPYPCIFVVGDSLLEIEECYVAFMEMRYKLSYENCLAVCVQIFTVLKIEEPPPSQYFWQFIRGYLFNIAKDKEKVYAVMENMVRYLETAAST